MKRIFVCIFCLLLAASVCHGQPVTDDVYVDTDESSGTQDGNAWATAYDCLQDAITAEARDLTSGAGEVCKIHLRGSTLADVNAVAVNGFTTSATQYVWIIVDSEDRHAGTYSTSKYRITVTDDECLSIQDQHVRVDGIQCGLTTSAGDTDGHCIVVSGVSAGNDIRISNCIMNGVSISGYGQVNGIRSTDADAVIDIWNCVVDGFLSSTNPASENLVGIRVAGDTDIWNCTIYDCYYGIAEYGSTSPPVINCIVFECTDDFGGSITMTYCLSNDDHTGDSATNQVITQTGGSPAYAALVTNAAGGDFSLTDSSSEAVGFGTDDPGGAVQDDTDIVLTSRTSTWDAGAFEDVPISNSQVIIIMMSVVCVLGVPIIFAVGDKK